MEVLNATRYFPSDPGRLIGNHDPSRALEPLLLPPRLVAASLQPVSDPLALFTLARFSSAVTGYQPVMEREEFVALAAPDKRGVQRLVALGATKVEHRQGNETHWRSCSIPRATSSVWGER
jgi:hypothetical protein